MEKNDRPIKKSTEHVTVVEKFNLEDLLLSKTMCSSWRDKLIHKVYPDFGLTNVLVTPTVNFILSQLSSHERQTAIKWLEDQHLVKRNKEKIVYAEYKDSNTGETKVFKQSDTLVVKAKSNFDTNWEICEIDLRTGEITLFNFPDDAAEEAEKDGLDLKRFGSEEDDDEAYINIKKDY